MTNTLTSTSADFRSVKQLNRRLNLNRTEERDSLISVDELDLPQWQRQLVWSKDEMGLLAFSIIKRYPIGMIQLWKKPNGLRVPIDGRQRITAIKLFYEGEIAIPENSSIPQEYWNKKYRLLENDDTEKFEELNLDDIESFDDYELSIRQYDGLGEEIAMDIFLRLQGGKCLTKTEIRAALGGKVCDFVTKLTSGCNVETEGGETHIPNHDFFRLIEKNIKNKRKQHRNIADWLLHEYLYPNKNKHWQSLESMYKDKAVSLQTRQEVQFCSLLNKFIKDIRYELEDGDYGIINQLRKIGIIFTVFKVWMEIKNKYDTPENFSFANQIIEFENKRSLYPDDIPWSNFTYAISNASYSENRIDARQDIMMNYILKNNPDICAKDRDPQRLFTMQQKLAIWELANHQCQHEVNGKRCSETFDDPREADADHIVRWNNNGATTVSNGRLLCQRHNRGR